MIVTFIAGDKQADFKVEKHDLIKDVLEVLNESTELKVNQDLQYVISERRKQKINVLYTFAQAKIYNGDVLKTGEL